MRMLWIKAISVPGTLLKLYKVQFLLAAEQRRQLLNIEKSAQDERVNETS